MQLAALESALLDGDAARNGWRTLSDVTNRLDAMDVATFRMLPMVYRNLTHVGFEESELGPLKGIYRQAWYRNRIAHATAFSLLETLANAGIDSAALKGLGLTSSAYPEVALRPMHDVDLLFRPDQWLSAVEALLAAGWKPARGNRAAFLRRARVFHALPLIGNDGMEVDLHRFMLEECCFSGADSAAWKRTVKVHSSGRTIRTLAPEDHVINACVHGVRWDPVPALRWVLDTVMVVRAVGGSFDWKVVEAEAQARHVTLAVGAALQFARRFEPSIPNELPDRLMREKSSRLERWDFRFQQGGNSVTSQIGRYLTRYLRLSARRSFIRRIADFPTYLECMWELDRPRQVPLEGFRRIWKRLRSR